MKAIKIIVKSSISYFVILSTLLIPQVSFSAAYPAGDRVFMGAFVDRDWSASNVCGDKQTFHWEWDNSEQWFGNTNPYFAKIFPEWFMPDGNYNYYAFWREDIARIKEQGRIPYINWEAHGQTADQQCWHGAVDRVNRNIISEINSGQHDAYIVDMALSLRAENTKIVMDLFHEMNGSWYDWSPCKYNISWETWRNAYKRVVDLFRASGATNVEFGSSVWFQRSVPNNGVTETWFCEQDDSQAPVPVSEIYIDGYMDWIGVDIYSSPQVSFSTLMDKWYSELVQTRKPIVIGEMGVTNDAGKAAWMTEFKNALVRSYPQVKAFNWFDIDKGWINDGEADWRIEAGGNGPHFDKLMTDVRFVGSFGVYEIVNQYTGECLDVVAAARNDGANLQAYPCNGTDAQTFTLTDMGNFEIELRALNSDKCVDVTAAEVKNGANVQQYSCNATNAQIWKMEVLDWSTLHIRLHAKNSQKCLDLDIGSNNVQQWTCSNTDNQLWRLRKR